MAQHRIGTPARRSESDAAGRAAERFDERDTMFARMARSPGTPAYEDYYERRPELKRTDDRLRRMPELLGPGALFYDPVVSGEAAGWFNAIDAIRVDESLVAAWAGRLAGADGREAARLLRSLARELGAVAAGCAAVEPSHVYSHRGRHDSDYGDPIPLEHPWALVFLVEMDHAAMRRAPRADVVRESARQYHRAATIARTLEAVLRRAGHAARAQYDAHYDVILPPLAVAAGLGELGRNNILVADRYGARVRIGAVSTTLELPPERPISLGVARFCEVCGRCAGVCPSRSLSPGAREMVRGTAKWPTRVEPCYGFWRQVGSDCGICMAACPFSHRGTPFHNTVRWLLKRAPILARPLYRLDEWLYGRYWRTLPRARRRR